MAFVEDFLMHHGIKGQKWGVKNGPPYPLQGVKVRTESYVLSRKGDQKRIIGLGKTTQTLSYDKNRINGAEMYYAALTDRDKRFYRAMFNKKIPNDVYDEKGERIGPSFYLKYNIRTSANKDVNVANERDGIEAFSKLMQKSKDFSNFVLDPKRMESAMDERRKNYPAYKEALATLDKVRKNQNDISSSDLASIYRVFNYIIPAEGSDIARQRARFFKQCKKDGFGAVLDTNDAIYGKFKRDMPIIIFDTSSFDFLDANRTTFGDKTLSSVAAILGI